MNGLSSVASVEAEGIVQWYFLDDYEDTTGESKSFLRTFELSKTI